MSARQALARTFRRLFALPDEPNRASEPALADMPPPRTPARTDSDPGSAAPAIITVPTLPRASAAIDSRPVHAALRNAFPMPEPERYATELLHRLQSDAAGCTVLWEDVYAVYRDIVIDMQWHERHWNAVSHALTLMTEGRLHKYYATVSVGGVKRRVRAFRIPAQASARATPASARADSHMHMRAAA